MDSEFFPVTIGECCDITTGFPFKSAYYIDTPEGIRLVRGDNIVQGSLRWDGVKRWDPEDLDEALEAKYSLKENDVVLAMDRPWIEAGLKYSSIGRYDLPSLLVQRVARLRAKSGVEQRLLKYIIGSKAFTNHVLSIQTGTAVPHISSKQIAEYSFSLPPRADQEAIAHILGTLDDKIELNRKTNETLEGIAKALFKSWFVDFDPVRAKAEGRPTGLPDEISELFPDSFEDSELGEIPSGWRVSEISTLCQFISSGGTPSRKNPAFWANGSIKWFKTGELGDSFVIDSEEHITQEGLNGSSCKLFDDGDILFALYGATVGKIGVVTCPSTSNQAAACLRPLKEVGTPFLECLLYATRDRLINIATGAAQQNLYLGVVKQHLIVSPSCPLPEVFSNLVSPVNNRRLQCLKQANTLQSLRNALLPRLISGELRVPAAEKMLEEVGI